eukprot:235770-Pelagomonas_calceolata.AAC.3
MAAAALFMQASTRTNKEGEGVSGAGSHEKGNRACKRLNAAAPTAALPAPVPPAASSPPPPHLLPGLQTGCCLTTSPDADPSKNNVPHAPPLSK